jgi:hypothetical protein
MAGGGKSSQTQHDQFTDNRAVVGEGALYATSGAHLNNYVLDGGAIGRAFDFGNTTLAGFLNFGKDTLALAKHNTDQLMAAAGNSQRLVADAYENAKGRGALTDKILIGAIGAMALIAFMAVRKG